MINCRGIPKQRKNRATSRLAKISQPHTCLAKISQRLPTIHKSVFPYEIHAKFKRGCKFISQTTKSISQPCEFQQPLCEMPTVSGKAKGHLKQAYLKTSRYPICLYSFHKPIYSLRSPAPPCELVFFPFHAPRPPI